MIALANQGYLVIAPDMPGCGETDGLAKTEDDNVVRIRLSSGAHCKPDSRRQLNRAGTD